VREYRWIIAAILVIIVAAIGGIRLGSQIGHSTETLSWTCAVNGEDSYTLDVINRNANTVNVSDMTVAFYGNGAIMGEDTTSAMIIPPNNTYVYQGSFGETALGGMPDSCREIQWETNG
jgi:hypothetical protein